MIRKSKEEKKVESICSLISNAFIEKD